jgi:hypothetical protein
MIEKKPEPPAYPEAVNDREEFAASSETIEKKLKAPANPTAVNDGDQQNHRPIQRR